MYVLSINVCCFVLCYILCLNVVCVSVLCVYTIHVRVYRRANVCTVNVQVRRKEGKEWNDVKYSVFICFVG